MTNDATKTRTAVVAATGAPSPRPAPMGNGIGARPPGVAQICNLPYRRFVIGKAHYTTERSACSGALQNGLLRYGRLQIRATPASKTCVKQARWPRAKLGAAALAMLIGLSRFQLHASTIPVIDSITRALNSANAGDTLLVSGPNVFHEHVVVAKSVRLLGTNAPVIDADGSGTALTIAAPDVEVRGLIIRNSGRDLGAFDSGVMLAAPRAIVHDCHIANDAFGIYVRGVEDCVIEGNEILGSRDRASSARGNGIHLWKTRRNRVLGNTIYDKRDGMYFSYADDNLIAGNRVTDTRFGIHYMYSHRNRLLTNSLTHNAVGVTLMFSRQSLVEGNVVLANRRHGMVLKQLDNSRIADNLVAGQNRGLFVQQASQNRFEGNVIATNDIGLYLSNGSEQNVFVGNAFIRNTDQVWQPPFETEQGRKNPNAFSENGRGNYWSDYTGSDRNHDGIGETPYHETDVFGYIVDRHPEARVFALSPAVTLLRKGEELMPLANTTGVTDLAPLMRPAATRNGVVERRNGVVEYWRDGTTPASLSFNTPALQRSIPAPPGNQNHLRPTATIQR